jgi:hypothetical protein
VFLVLPKSSKRRAAFPEHASLHNAVARVGVVVFLMRCFAIVVVLVFLLVFVRFWGFVLAFVRYCVFLCVFVRSCVFVLFCAHRCGRLGSEAKIGYSFGR